MASTHKEINSVYSLNNNIAKILLNESIDTGGYKSPSVNVKTKKYQYFKP